MGAVAAAAAAAAAATAAHQPDCASQAQRRPALSAVVNGVVAHPSPWSSQTSGSEGTPTRCTPTRLAARGPARTSPSPRRTPSKVREFLRSRKESALQEKEVPGEAPAAVVEEEQHESSTALASQVADGITLTTAPAACTLADEVMRCSAEPQSPLTATDVLCSLPGAASAAVVELDTDCTEVVTQKMTADASNSHSSDEDEEDDFQDAQDTESIPDITDITKVAGVTEIRKSPCPSEAQQNVGEEAQQSASWSASAVQTVDAINLARPDSTTSHSSEEAGTVAQNNAPALASRLAVPAAHDDAAAELTSQKVDDAAELAIRRATVAEKSAEDAAEPVLQTTAPAEAEEGAENDAAESASQKAALASMKAEVIMLRLYADEQRRREVRSKRLLNSGSDGSGGKSASRTPPVAAVWLCCN